MQTNQKTYCAMRSAVICVSINEIAPLIQADVKRGADIRLTVTGNSMYPMLRGGRDSVILTAPLPDTLKKYAIPFYRRDNGQYILHRIIRIKNGLMSVSGDNQTCVEYPVGQHQVIAVVKGFYRGNRYIPCNNSLYRFYAWVWANGMPARKPMMRAYLGIARMLSKLRKK